MNYLTKFIAIMGFVSISFIAHADTITDTYSTGDTLTATTLNNIKSAVNGNDGNITNNTTNITTNAANISNNATDINDNANDISANTADITINVSGISDNAADISANGVEIDANALDIGTNVTNISANTSAIGALFSGDGSAGPLTITSATNWSNNPVYNTNFTDVVIEAGNTLFVPAGTVIRCTGSFTNNGTITVLPGAFRNGSGFSAASTTGTTYEGGITNHGHPGDTYGQATSPDYNNNQLSVISDIDGGRGGRGIPQTTAASAFNSFKIGGGSASGWSNDGEGGGLLKVYCNGTITNADTITANGENAFTSSGGGGGGIVILGSQTSVDNTTGTILADGGNGGSSAGWTGAGGGGGGGIVILAAPVVNTSGGTVSVLGGSAGTTSTTSVAFARAVGGGGGGASGGNGGSGGSIQGGTNTIFDGSSGNNGYSIEITANPAYMR